MATRDKRARATGRLGVKREDRYALMPEDVMHSAAYHSQPDWAKSVLFAVAARYNGHNNGDLSLPFREAKSLGIAAQWKLYAALKLLTLSGLVICTRRGRLERGIKLASLYAMTWRGIDPCERVQFDHGVTKSPLPQHLWAHWSKPADWQQQVKAIARANHGRSTTKNPVSTMLGNGHSTTLGPTVRLIAQPCWGMETLAIAPNMVETSKTLGGSVPIARSNTARRPNTVALASRERSKADA